MFLRASEPDADIEAVLAEDGGDAGVADGAELRRFALAVLAGDWSATAEAGRAVEQIFGPSGRVDAAATVLMFNSINRVADATGTILEDPYSETAALIKEGLRRGASRGSAEPLDAGPPR